MRRFNLGSAVLAGVVGTIVITIALFATGTNIVAMLGGMLTGGSGPGALAVGTVVHFTIGIVFALIFALVIEPLMQAPKLLEGLGLGFVAFALAMATMPLMAAMVGPSDGPAASGNPCAAAANPCAAAANPCAAATPQAANPCAGSGNPCAANPCAAKTNPCAAAANPCSPQAKPCAGGSAAGAQAPTAPLVSLVNHLIFGAVVGLV
jgi:hypothetical protein